MRHTRGVGCLVLALLTATASSTTMAQKKSATSDAADLRAKAARFAPTVITADAGKLSPGDRKALDKLIRAAEYLDPLYVRQVWSGNAELEHALSAANTPEGRARYAYFMINKAPWSKLDEDRAFVSGVPATRPPQAAYYPDDMTKDEFEAWAKTLSPEERAKAEGFFYVIRRDASGKLTTVPYSEEYKAFLEPAAKLLREAAALSDNPTLKAFLTKRADAFSSNDYYESDLAWMDLDAPIDVTIGPYETYSDGLFGYKAAFEAYVNLRDDAETAKLAKFGTYLQELEDHLPIDARYRNPKIGASSPIRVVNEVYASGEAASGVQTAAYNLPNDERVIDQKGSKRVMLKNIQEAKFEKTLVPISKVVLDAGQRKDVAFDAFFTHVLMHELMHGLGPHNLTVDGQQVAVRLRLKDTYSAIEEAKADVSGLWALQYLVDKGALDKSFERTMYATFLASIFRSVRFGIAEAHGKGVALQFNYLFDEGAIRYDEKTGTFAVVPDKIKDAVRKLTAEIMTIQAEGSYDRAKALLDKYGVVRPEMRKALDRLSAVPVDIAPSYPLAKS